MTEITEADRQHARRWGGGENEHGMLASYRERVRKEALEEAAALAVSYAVIWRAPAESIAADILQMIHSEPPPPYKKRRRHDG